MTTLLVHRIVAVQLVALLPLPPPISMSEAEAIWSLGSPPMWMPEGDFMLSLFLHPEVAQHYLT